MWTILSIILGLFCFYMAKIYLYKPQTTKNFLIYLLFGVLFGTFILLIPVVINTAYNYIKYTFKPLYQIDPKQDSYIILNGEQYDTVPR